MTEKWINRHISNMEYLLYVNLIGGRSFYSLSQYPIFPWLLKDYSKNCNFEDYRSYRNLAKTLGDQGSI